VGRWELQIPSAGPRTDVEGAKERPNSLVQAEYAEGRDDVENRWMLSPLRRHGVGVRVGANVSVSQQPSYEGALKSSCAESPTTQDRRRA